MNWALDCLRGPELHTHEAFHTNGPAGELILRPPATDKKKEPGCWQACTVDRRA
jgi:hypothetical protein